jgi:hypothetical protein
LLRFCCCCSSVSRSLNSCACLADMQLSIDQPDQRSCRPCECGWRNQTVMDVQFQLQHMQSQVTVQQVSGFSVSAFRLTPSLCRRTISLSPRQVLLG